MFLFLSLVRAGYIIQSQWESLECQTAPDIIGIINDSFTTALTDIADNLSPIPYCGLACIDIYSGCCFKITFNTSSPFSFERHPIDTVIPEQYPSTANNIEYCQLKSFDSGFTFGYAQVNYLDNNKCLDDFFVCNGGTFSIYSGVQCTGSRNDINIPDSRLYNITGYGNMSVSKVKISGGTVKTVWVTGNMFDGIPPHTDGYNSFEIVGILFSAISLLSYCCTFGYYVLKFKAVSSNSNFWIAVTQIVWLSRCITTIMNNYYGAGSTAGNNILGSVWCGSCICTHMSAMISCTIIIRLFNLEQDKTKCYFLYGLVTVISLVLGGPTYFYFIYFLEENNSWINDLYYYSVDQMYFAWELFMLLFDMIPPIVILIRMKAINLGKLKKDQSALFSKWRAFVFILVAIGAVNIASYVLMFVLQYYSLVLGGDVQFASVWLIALLNYCVHHCLILVIFESLKEMMKITVRKTPVQMPVKPLDSNKESTLKNTKDAKKSDLEPK
ncbi:hypothetical protein HDV04_003662 [Boothiomyces sp. JEL0838]|nr:hypothetical protein HDV04_003662 [Boothiomyces sp. JEL0838]